MAISPMSFWLYFLHVRTENSRSCIPSLYFLKKATTSVLEVFPLPPKPMLFLKMCMIDWVLNGDAGKFSTTNIVYGYSPCRRRRRCCCCCCFVIFFFYVVEPASESTSHKGHLSQSITCSWYRVSFLSVKPLHVKPLPHLAWVWGLGLEYLQLQQEELEITSAVKLELLSFTMLLDK